MKIKVLHYSDCKCENIDELYKVCDILIATGDLSSFDFGKITGSDKPAFGVYGNHDDGMYFKKIGISNMHNNVASYKDIKLGGFQGCLKYKNSDLMFTESEAKEFSKSFPAVDILLLHCGPQGILDESSFAHEGSEGVLDYVLNKKPKYVFCGHQDTNGFAENNNTKFFRTYGARIIEIEV